MHPAEAQQGLCLPQQAGAHGRLVHRPHHVRVEAAVGAALAAVGPLRARGVWGTALPSPSIWRGSSPKTVHAPQCPHSCPTRHTTLHVHGSGTPQLTPTAGLSPPCPPCSHVCASPFLHLAVCQPHLKVCKPQDPGVSALCKPVTPRAPRTQHQPRCPPVSPRVPAHVHVERGCGGGARLLGRLRGRFHGRTRSRCSSRATPAGQSRSDSRQLPRPPPHRRHGPAAPPEPSGNRAGPPPVRGAGAGRWDRGGTGAGAGTESWDMLAVNDGVLGSASCPGAGNTGVSVLSQGH